SFGEDFDGGSNRDPETWKVISLLRGSLSEIMDLAWSPDGEYIIAACTEGAARIWRVRDASCVCILMDHVRNVQGVAWDPLGEYIATQGCDRSVHVYSYSIHPNGAFVATHFSKNYRVEISCKNDDFKPTNISVNDQTNTFNNYSSSEVPITQNSVFNNGQMKNEIDCLDNSTTDEAPKDNQTRQEVDHLSSSKSDDECPNKLLSSDTQENGNSHLVECSEVSEFKHVQYLTPTSKNLDKVIHRPYKKRFRLYCEEAVNTFFRRLTFTPDGGLLLTPAGQYRESIIDLMHNKESRFRADSTMLNTVYLFARNRLNRAPIAYLSGYRKPSIVVKCNPVLYRLRFDRQNGHLQGDKSSSLNDSNENLNSTSPHNHCRLFDLPYRIIYAVATQDSIFIYDTEQYSPLAMATNLHYASISDLDWSPDGNSLLLASQDGYCSIMTFHDGELGVQYDEYNPIKNNLPVVGLVSLPADFTVNNQTPATPNVLTSQKDHNRAGDTRNIQQNPTLISVNPDPIYQQSSNYINQTEYE
ncbi:3670_t:CDS:2, partial [Acaulospora morrowiae]